VITQLQPRLVTAIPDRPEAGVLYVSVKYATTVHLCACGCGHEVVLGISATDWMLCWDGQAVSLTPSVGNWSLPCRSHYFIRGNRIAWAPQWSDDEIAAGRRQDAARKRSATDPIVAEHAATPAIADRSRGRWHRLVHRLMRRL
jgi:hypothetical protein